MPTPAFTDTPAPTPYTMTKFSAENSASYSMTKFSAENSASYSMTKFSAEDLTSLEKVTSSFISISETFNT